VRAGDKFSKSWQVDEYLATFLAGPRFYRRKEFAARRTLCAFGTDLRPNRHFRKVDMYSVSHVALLQVGF
jgi:hypothetical protein